MNLQLYIQSWAPAGVVSQKQALNKPPSKKIFTIYGDHFGTSFSQDGHLSPCGSLFCFLWGAFFLACPTKMSAIAYAPASRHAISKGKKLMPSPCQILATLLQLYRTKLNSKINYLFRDSYL